MKTILLTNDDDDDDDNNNNNNNNNLHLYCAGYMNIYDHPRITMIKN